MGFWRIEYIENHRGERADKLSEAVSVALLRTARATDPVAWRQFRAILKELLEDSEEKG
mgnify:CR=1 FL=1